MNPSISPTIMGMMDDDDFYLNLLFYGDDDGDSDYRTPAEELTSEEKEMIENSAPFTGEEIVQLRISGQEVGRRMFLITSLHFPRLNKGLDQDFR